MASKIADRNFLQGQSVDLFRAAIKSQATRDPYERRPQVRTDSVIRRAISIAFLVLPMCNAASAIPIKVPYSIAIYQ
jgi:hypothetical protein